MSSPLSENVTKPSYNWVTTFQPAMSSVLPGSRLAAGSTLFTEMVCEDGEEFELPDAPVPAPQPARSVPSAAMPAMAAPMRW